MASQLSPEEQNFLNNSFYHLVANKYYVLASTVVLIYDHLLTIERERRHIWNQKNSLPTYLFYMFRYTTPIISLINLIGQHAPWWTGSLCTNWIWLPIASGVIVSATTGVILILRVHAIYSRASWVLWIIVPIFLGEISVMIYAQPAGTATPLPPGFIGCIPGERPGSGHRLSYMYIAAMIFDATIFIFTFGRAVHMRLHRTSVPLREIIIRDGTLYFTVLFAVNLVNVLLLSLAPVDLGAINAPFATIITSILVARLMLNLREAGQKSSMLLHTNHSLHSQNRGIWLPQQEESSRTNTGMILGCDPREYQYTQRRRKGTTALYDIIGLDEFDVPLGDISDDGSSQDSNPPVINFGYEAGPIHHR